MGLDRDEKEQDKPLIDHLGVIDKYERLLNELIRSLKAEGYLKEQGHHLQIPEKIKTALSCFDLKEAIEALQTTYPDYKTHGTLLQVCLQSFRAILQGGLPATDVIFPEGSMELVSGIYKGNPQADYYNKLLCDLVKTTIEKSLPNLKEGEGFTLLEVGAGTGGTSSLLFEVLKDYKDKIRYIYTDISKSFLLYGEQHFKEKAPYLETQIFNIEQSADVQNIALGSCDMVIGANVVHATQAIGTSLENIKGVLKQDGLLVLNELAQTAIFTTLTFGLLEGWWLYKDKALRLEGSPGLSKESWARVLHQTGYNNITSYPDNQPSYAQQIITAQSDGRVVLQSEKLKIKKKQGKVSTKRYSDSAVDTNAEVYIKRIFKNILKLDEDRIDVNAPFESMGIDSILIGSFTKEFSKDFNKITATTFFEYRTIRELSDYLAREYRDFFSKQSAEKSLQYDNHTVLRGSNRKQSNRKIKRSSVTPNVMAEDSMAIIGMHGHFSNAATEDQLWHISRETIQANFVKENGCVYGHLNGMMAQKRDWSVVGMDHELADNTLSVQEIMIFDSLSQAMINHGMTKKDLSSKPTGVFIAAQQVVYNGQENSNKANKTLAYLIPNKVSFYLNLEGPSEIVNTYCTSVYVAIHRAIQSIEAGECEQAIVGGVNVISPEEVRMAQGTEFETLFSKDGYTRSFCNDGHGFVRSEGVGVIIIKPLEAARKDQNTILGLIKGSTVHHGGKGFSLEAPRAKGLKTAISKAIEKSKVDADTIDYIEAHGIANPMADAIELSAINDAYKKRSKDPDKKWYVGSVKPVVGHPELASGMASLIKVLKAFQHKTIPGIAGLGEVTQELTSDHSLLLTKTSIPWQNGTHPRRAALNSYAVGGVNAHIILEEYPNIKENKIYKETSFESDIFTERVKSYPEVVEVQTNEKSVTPSTVLPVTSVHTKDNEPDVIIIGAGIAGLVSACYLVDP